jgi:hypothetical protein
LKSKCGTPILDALFFASGAQLQETPHFRAITPKAGAAEANALLAGAEAQAVKKLRRRKDFRAQKSETAD